MPFLKSVVSFSFAVLNGAKIDTISIKPSKLLSLPRNIRPLLFSVRGSLACLARRYQPHTYNSTDLFTRDGLSLRQNSCEQLATQTMGKSYILWASRGWPVDLSGICSPWPPGQPARQRKGRSWELSPALPKILCENVGPGKVWKQLGCCWTLSAWYSVCHLQRSISLQCWWGLLFLLGTHGRARGRTLGWPC